VNIHGAHTSSSSNIEMGWFSQKTPQEVLRENKRMLDRSIRELDRERTGLEAQERKTVADMKKMAKAGQEVERI
jgi:charged multivesicular body protein 2A